MRVSKKDLMDKLGVGYEIGPYETFPWSYTDPDGSRTCSAEVRMDSEGREAEAEIQIMYETPPAGKPPVEAVCLIKAQPVGGDEWDVVSVKIRNEPIDPEMYNWQEKACRFFLAVVQEIQTDTFPDIDELIDRYLHNRERLSDQSQGGGGKAPKVGGQALLGMKKGGSF